MGLKILNHINSKKEIGEMMTKRLGFGLTDVHDCLKGDQEKIKQLGEAAQQGRAIIENADKIENALREVVEGTATLAKVKASVLRASGKAGTTINKALVDAHNANKEYVQRRDELALQFDQDQFYMDTTHEQRMKRLRNSHNVRMYTSHVDDQYQTEQLASSLHLKQIKENERFRKELNDHYLETGSDSDPQLISKKEYVPENESSNGSGFTGMIRNLLNIVGL